MDQLQHPEGLRTSQSENSCSTLISHFCFGEEIRRWRDEERKTRAEQTVLQGRGEELEDTVTEGKSRGIELETNGSIKRELEETEQEGGVGE